MWNKVGWHSYSFEERFFNLAHFLLTGKNLTIPQLTSHPCSCFVFLLRWMGVVTRSWGTKGPGRCTLFHLHPVFHLETASPKLDVIYKKSAVSCQKSHTYTLNTNTHNTWPAHSYPPQWHSGLLTLIPRGSPEGHMWTLRNHILFSPRGCVGGLDLGLMAGQSVLHAFPTLSFPFSQWTEPLNRLNRPPSTTATSLPNENDKEIG